MLPVYLVITISYAVVGVPARKLEVRLTAVMAVVLKVPVLVSSTVTVSTSLERLVHGGVGVPPGLRSTVPKTLLVSVPPVITTLCTVAEAGVADRTTSADAATMAVHALVSFMMISFLIR